MTNEYKETAWDVYVSTIIQMSKVSSNYNMLLKCLLTSNFDDMLAVKKTLQEFKSTDISPMKVVQIIDECISDLKEKDIDNN